MSLPSSYEHVLRYMIARVDLGNPEFKARMATRPFFNKFGSRASKVAGLSDCGGVAEIIEIAREFYPSPAVQECFANRRRPTPPQPDRWPAVLLVEEGSPEPVSGIGNGWSGYCPRPPGDVVRAPLSSGSGAGSKSCSPETGPLSGFWFPRRRRSGRRLSLMR